MSSLLAEQKHFLNFLMNTPPKQRKLLLSSVTREQLKVLCEIAANVIHSVIVLNPEEKKILKKYKTFYLTLGDRDTSRKVKLRSLKRKEKAIVALLEIVKPFLTKWWK